MGIALHHPQLAIAGQSVFAVYLDSRNGSDDLYLNRSTDGGENWELVLYVDENSGASDLSMDMTNSFSRN